MIYLDFVYNTFTRYIGSDVFRIMFYPFMAFVIVIACVAIIRGIICIR